MKIKLFILLNLFCVFAFSKGIDGVYTISGIMISKETKKAISDSTFIINGLKIKTNKLGEFTTNMNWSTICGFRSNFISRNKAYRKLNPQFINIIYNNKEKKIRNKWKTYGLNQFYKKEHKVYYLKIFW